MDAVNVSRRRAALAVVSWPLAPPCVVVLVVNDRMAGALVLGLLFFAYVAVEVFLFERREIAARRRYWTAEHAMAGPLTGYAPQVEDRLYADFDRSHGGAA